MSNGVRLKDYQEDSFSVIKSVTVLFSLISVGEVVSVYVCVCEGGGGLIICQYWWDQVYIW